MVSIPPKAAEDEGKNRPHQSPSAIAARHPPMRGKDGGYPPPARRVHPPIARIPSFE
jgi:hypothetical protein